MDLIDHLHMQLRLEGKSVVGAYSLRQVEAIPDEELPLMLIAQLADQELIAYFDESLPLGMQKKLTAHISSITFPNIDPIVDILNSYNIQPETGHYKTYLFPAWYADLNDQDVNIHSKHDPKIQAFGFDGFTEQVYALERNGRIISACVSARENEQCGEAWVFTDPEYRNQGMAQRVVGAWAKRLINAGKTPFYSHKMENYASARLANRLGLQRVFEEISISQAQI